MQMRKMAISVGSVALAVLLLAATAASVFVAALHPALPWLALASGALLILFAISGSHFFRQAERQQEYYQYTDTFCGLPNAAQFERDLELMPVREGRVLVIIRLNSFNRLNSLFGTEIGGATFRRLCPPIKQFAERHAGYAYRMAMDRFGLLLSTKSQQKFLVDLGKLLDELEQIRVEYHGLTYSYHYTFAYAVYFMSSEEAGESLESLVTITSSAVDRLQNHNITSGKVFSDKNRPDWALQASLTAEIRGAWARREFVPYYQLVYDLRTGRPVGAETLTRWQHPTRGIVMPGDFLPVMDSEGLTMDLDLYMLEEACKRIQGWMDAELVTVPLSINSSKLNIHRVDFVDRLIAIADAYDVPTVLLEIELSEAVLLYEKNDAFLEVMNRLHDSGFTLTMDDFAADDFSSINLLRDLPVDVIKLSGRFFNNVTESPRDWAFVTNVLRMAAEMNIRVVAMGVETQEQADLCRRLGCQMAQGYFFSRPMSNEEFEKVIF